MEQPDSGQPGPHPAPPSDLNARRLPIVQLNTDLFRLHRIDRDPLHFGRAAQFRFDAPDGAFGVLYVGDGPGCAFIETFGRLGGALRLVTDRELAGRGLVRITSRRPLRLVDLTAVGLRRLDADNWLCTGDYRIAQRWSAALHNHPDQPDGVRYRSRHDPSLVCVAICERAGDLLNVEHLSTLIDTQHARLLADLLDIWDFGLLVTTR